MDISILYIHWPYCAALCLSPLAWKSKVVELHFASTTYPYYAEERRTYSVVSKTRQHHSYLLIILTFLLFFFFFSTYCIFSSPTIMESMNTTLL